MIRRLQKKFIRISMLSVMLVMLTLCIIVNAANFISVDSGIKVMLDLISDNRGAIPSPGRSEPPSGRPGSRPAGPVTQETPYSTRFFVLRFNGDGFMSEANLRNIAAVTPDNVDYYLARALSHGTGYGYTDGYRFLVTCESDEDYMAVFIDCYQQMRTVKTFALLSVIAVAVCTLATYLLVLLFSRSAVAPVIRSAEQQKQFITDAGHELKTPLTVITTCLGVLKMEIGENKWLGKIQAQTDKMRDLVCGLVTLSRMDEEDPGMVRSDFDISAAVADTAESFRASAGCAGHELVTDIENGLQYHGDESAIRQLCSILLDNSVKYSAPGPIRISLKKERHGTVLRCSNACSGIEPDETGRLFDRFYRPDMSRSSATGGFGIGLSIARGIVEAHGGTICAQLKPGPVIEFTAALK